MPYDMQKLKKVPIDYDDEGNPIYNQPTESTPKAKKKAPMKKVNPRKAGGYLTTKGQKKRIIDEQLDYTLE